MAEQRDLTAYYQLDHVLGWTGSARTFRGRDPKTTRPVVVKLLSLARLPGSDALLQRFEKTLSILRSLSHPALPKIIDHGVTPAGDAFFVSEWIEGETLAALQPVPPSSLLPWAVQLLEALESLSLHGLVHLNISPENILVGVDGGARLLGWGRSLFTVDWQSSTERPMEMSAYSAPELRKPPEAADALWRADAYSLALLTTRLLGASVEGEGTDEPRVRFEKHLSIQLQRAEELREALQRCLHQRPEKRPDSYSEICRSVQHALPRAARRPVAQTQPLREISDETVEEASRPQAAPPKADRAAPTVAKSASAAEEDDPREAAKPPEADKGPAEGTGLPPIADTVPQPALSSVPIVEEESTPSAREAPREAAGSADASKSSGDLELDETLLLDDAPPRPPRPKQDLEKTTVLEPREDRKASPSPAAASKPASPPAKPVSSSGPPASSPAKPVSSPAAKPVSSPGQPASSPAKPVSSQGQPASSPAKPVSSPAAKPASSPGQPASSPAKPASSPADPRKIAAPPPVKPSKPSTESRGAATKETKAPAAPRQKPRTAPTVNGRRLGLVAAVVLFGFVGVGWLISALRGDGSSATELPAVAADVPPAPQSTGLELPEEAPVPLPEDLLQALEHVAAGEWLQAREALQELSDLEEEGELDEALCAAFRSIEEVVLLGRGEQLLGDLELGLERARVDSLRRALSQMSRAEERLVKVGEDGEALIARARRWVQETDEFERALREDMALPALVRANLLSEEIPELARALDARNRAVETVDEKVTMLVEAGRLEEARSTLQDLDRLWPNRPGTARRLEEIQRQLLSAERYETLLAEIENSGLRGRPHEGLAMLRTVQPPGDFAERYRQARETLEMQFRELDQQPPSVRLDPNHEIAYRKGDPLTLEILASDDYDVAGLELHLQVGREGDWLELSVEEASDGRYRAVINPNVHDGKILNLWIRAEDRSGHEALLGNEEEPIELRRRRWFRPGS